MSRNTETSKSKNARITAFAAGQSVVDARLKQLRRSMKYTSMPWMSDEGEPLGWSQNRISAAKLCCSSCFDLMMGIVITFNAFVIIAETDYEAQCYPKYANNISQCPQKKVELTWVNIANTALLILYTAELLLRVYVFRQRILVDSWNKLDAVIVPVCWVGVLLDGVINMAFLRVIRVVRLCKAIRVLGGLRELHMLISGVVSSIRAMTFGCLLIFLMLMIYGIMMVEWVHPANSQMNWSDCPDCSTAFSTVQYSIVSMFNELIAGGSWTMSLSLFKRDPKATVLIISVVVTINLAIMNLILAVVCEQAADAREKDTQENARQKNANLAEAKKDLVKLIERMDKDCSGRIDLQELLVAYERSQEFRSLMTVMDLDAQELQELFMIADREGRGEIEYEHFCNELYHVKNQDQHMLLTMIRLCGLETHHVMESVIRPHLEKLVEQGAMQTAQIATLDKKIEQLQICAKVVHEAQICPENSCTVEDGMKLSALTDQPKHQTISQKRDCTAINPLESISQPTPSQCLIKNESMESSELADIHALASQTQITEEGLKELQQEVQIMLDVTAFLVDKVALQLNTPLSKLTDSFCELANDCAIDAHNIHTLEVWLAERKYQRCKSAFNLVANVEQQRAEQQGMIMKDIVIAKEQLLSQLRGLLLQLLQLGTVAAPVHKSELSVPNTVTRV